MTPTPQQAANELLRRRKARRSLVDYSMYQWPGYRPAEHHRLIAEHLEMVERGEITRLMITMPPRHGKSMLASEYFPSWYLGRNPDHYVVAATYAQELADDFGRKVRNLIADESYANIFPGVVLKSDSTSSKRFHVSEPDDAFSTRQDGAYFAVGVGGPLTGRGAHLLLIDDPVKNREEAESELIRKKTKDWYTSTAYTRLMPGGRIVVIQCLTGDTLVTMADGSSKRIDEIQVSELVLSWDGSKHVASPVSGVINNGNDETYLITTKGASVRANGRHPFLVLSKDGLQWVRVKNLKPGMRIVRHQEVHTRGKPVLSTDATSKSLLGECASITTARLSGQQATGLHLTAARTGSQLDANGGTASIQQISTECLQSKTAFAPSAKQTEAKESPSIGSQTLFPTITTKQGSFAASYATIATGSQDELEIPPYWSAPSNTSEPDTDEVVSVEPFGVEPVYDLSVEGTHNFVANGLWTHNTRWHEDDLAGWLQDTHKHEGWVILDLPAINDDGEALWPEQYNVEALERIKRALPPRDWSALYQQRPSPETGDYFRKEWIHETDQIPPLSTLRIYGGSDYAVTQNGGDYTVHAVVGVDPQSRLYLLDLWRAQASSDKWVEAFCDLVKKWKPIGWAEETGQIKSGVGPFLIRSMLEKGAYVAREQFPTRGDKAIRAQSFRGRIASTGLHIPSDADWKSDLISEMMSFPVGVHDDQVDALGLVGQFLDRMMAGEPERAADDDAPPDDGYTYVKAPPIRRKR